MPTDDERTSVTSALRRRARLVQQQTRRATSTGTPRLRAADEEKVQDLSAAASRVFFSADVCNYSALFTHTLRFARSYHSVFDEDPSKPLSGLDARLQGVVGPSRARFDAVLDMAGQILQEACGCAPSTAGVPITEAAREVVSVDELERAGAARRRPLTERQRTEIRDVKDEDIAESLGRRGEANGGLGSAPQSAQVEEAISAAAEAVEVFGEDELERFAARQDPRLARHHALVERGPRALGAPNTDRSQSSAGLLSAADAADERARNEGTSL